MPFSDSRSRSAPLRRDPFVWCTAALYVVFAVPYFVPGLTQDALAMWGDVYAYILLHSLVVASLLVGFDKRASTRVHMFRYAFVAASTVMLTLDLVYVLIPASELWARVYAVTVGFSYSCYYFLALSALAVVPHRRSEDAAQAWLWLIRPLGLAVLLWGFVLYFYTIPVGNDVVPAPANEFLGNLIPFLVLDVVLVTVAFRLRRTTDSTAWRSIYGWLGVAFACALTVDTIDLLQRIAVLPSTNYGTLFDLLWLSWPAFIIVAGRVLAHAPAEEVMPADPLDEERSWFTSLSGSKTFVLALALPGIHLALSTSGWLDPAHRPARDALVLICVVAMGCIAVFHEHLLKRENERLARARAEANEQLQSARRLEGIGQLAAGIAHEFNNKLTVIQASGELLDARLPPDDEKRALTARILQTAEQSATIVRQLLGFSRKQVRRPTTMNLNERIEALSEVLKQTLGEDIHIVLELADRAPRITIDPAQFEQIVINLALNARHAMPAGGTLTFRTETVAETEWPRNRCTDGERHGLRDELRRRGARVRALLHDETGRRRNRARTRHRVRPRSAEPGGHRAGYRAWSGLDVSPSLPRRNRRGRDRSRPRASAAAVTAAKRLATSRRGRARCARVDSHGPRNARLLGARGRNGRGGARARGWARRCRRGDHGRRPSRDLRPAAR